MRRWMMQFGLGLTVVCAVNASAATIAQWSFNSVPPDGDAATGTTQPARGVATASAMGVSATFVSGGGSSDPATTDDSAWRLASFPGQGRSNKLAGVEFRVSTRGFANVTITFDLRGSATASRYARAQYSTNGVNFVDGPVLTLTTNDTFLRQTISLASVPAAGNNAQFAFRIVSEFEDSATGAGTNGYVAVGSTNVYRTTGTWQIDWVTVSGDGTENTSPTLSNIDDQTTAENTPLNDVTVTVNDAETPAQDLVVRAFSSNTNLLPNANIRITSGLDANTRLLALTPAPDRFGTSVVTVTVTDGGGLSTNDTFQFVVAAANLPPTISPVAHQSTLVGVATVAIPFTINDAETSPAALILSKNSSNPELLPADNIQLGGTDTNRTVTLAPLPGQTGTATIQLTVSDGQRSASQSFVLMVVPSANVKFTETFGYADGSLTTNSASFWTVHSGTGALLISNRQAQIAANRGEDLNARLIGAPHAAGAGTVLYCRFHLTLTALPIARGEYFLHYNTSDFRARVFASTTNAANGRYRLGLANASSTMSAQHSTDLALGTRYTVVTRYALDTSQTTLWIDPTAESDPAAQATDSAMPDPISMIVLRQNSGLGSIQIDDLSVSLTFPVETEAVRLRIRAAGADVEIAWPVAATGWGLQVTDRLSNPDWRPANDVASTEGDQRVIRRPVSAPQQYFRLAR